MLDLLRYQVIAVLQYSFTPDALYLQHLRQLQNLGLTEDTAHTKSDCIGND